LVNENPPSVIYFLDEGYAVKKHPKSHLKLIRFYPLETLIGTQIKEFSE